MAITEKEITVFVSEIIGGKSQREAYRIARPLSRKWTDKTVDERASVLFKTDKAQTRYKELLRKAQEQVENKLFLTIADKRRILLEIATDPNERKDNRIKAIDLDNKMEGVYINKTELTGGDGSPLMVRWMNSPDEKV